MPKILELKEIDGELWAKIKIREDEGSVTLFTNDELDSFALANRRMLLHEMRQWVNKQLDRIDG